MKSDLLQIIDKSLSLALREVDEKTQSKIREEWRKFSPPHPYVPMQKVIEPIQAICLEGIKERETTATNQLVRIIGEHESLLTKNMVKDIIDIVWQHFPTDIYVQFASKTKEVAERRMDKTKIEYELRSFELTMSLIAGTSANLTRRSVSRIIQLLNERELVARSKRDGITKIAIRFLFGGVKQIVAWVATILSAVIVYYLTSNG